MKTSHNPLHPQSSWPGERSASQRDVELANEPLTPDFLGAFKHALVASSAGQDNEVLLHRSLENVVRIYVAS